MCVCVCVGDMFKLLCKLLWAFAHYLAYRRDNNEHSEAAGHGADQLQHEWLRCGAGCDRGVRGGVHGEGTRERSYTADTATALSRRHVTCPAVAPQPGRSNNRNHLFDCAGQGCGAYVPLDLTPAQARPSARFKSKIWGHMSCVWI